MELVGNVVQSIAEYFSLEALSTKANFPFEMKNILEICEKVCFCWGSAKRLLDFKNFVKAKELTTISTVNYLCSKYAKISLEVEKSRKKTRNIWFFIA